MDKLSIERGSVYFSGQNTLPFCIPFIWSIIDVFGNINIVIEKEMIREK